VGGGGVCVCVQFTPTMQAWQLLIANNWQSLANHSMLIQDLYVGTVPIPQFIKIMETYDGPAWRLISTLVYARCPQRGSSTTMQAVGFARRSRIQVDRLYSRPSPAGYNACAWTQAARQSVQSILGGVHPSSLRPPLPETSGDAPPFLKALFTHRISRSCPRPPRAAQPSAHSLPPRLRPCGCLSRSRRTLIRVHAAARSNSTCVRSTLCGRPRSLAVPTPITCGSCGNTL